MEHKRSAAQPRRDDDSIASYTVEGICARVPQRSDAVARVHRPDPERFQREFVDQSRPAIITGIQDGWPAMARWSLDYFADTFGDLQCHVNVQRQSEYMILGKIGEFMPATIRQLVEILKNPPDDRIYYLRAFPVQKLIEHAPAFASDFEVPRACPNFLDVDEPARSQLALDPMRRALRWAALRFFSQALQITPLSAERARRYRQRGLLAVLFLGGAGTVTPMHADGMTTGAYLSQVVGRKYFYMLPPDQDPLVYPRPFRRQFGMSMVDFRQPDLERHPRFKYAQPIEFIVHPGETLYIPHRWWHAVIALDLSISYSCQIVNDANVMDWIRCLPDRAAAVAYNSINGGLRNLVGAADWD